ncbi:MAG TPA: twin-arginine translocase TatA/TatE family subunit [Flavipsychrobacter sp.]|nr:twin-arginine translocase TatA/TatE family subunit [Flavipsychrobacter sp.]
MLYSENMQLLLAMPSGMEFVWILLIVILLFGAKKIPELAKGLGKGIKEFKDAKEEGKNEIDTEEKK